MPIVSRQLDFARPQRPTKFRPNGFFRCRVSAIDSKGRRYTHGRFDADTLADAEDIRDSIVFDVSQEEENEIYELVRNGWNPETYSREELSLREMQKRLFERASQMRFEDQKRFLCSAASYIATFTAREIARIMEISLIDAQRVWTRFTRLKDGVCPRLALDDEDVRDV